MLIAAATAALEASDERPRALSRFVDRLRDTRAQSSSSSLSSLSSLSSFRSSSSLVAVGEAIDAAADDDDGDATEDEAATDADDDQIEEEFDPYVARTARNRRQTP